MSLARIRILVRGVIQGVGFRPFRDFAIRESDAGGSPTGCVLPDLGTCRECVAELFDPANRRYLYPFINCTNCGPRFTIIERLPYDRINTTMRMFEMCDRCRREYDNPADRRFHAQPNACPRCGPHVEMWDANRRPLARKEAAIRDAAKLVRGGGILALKGIGGFQFVVDAADAEAVSTLRSRKRRKEKPFAIMAPDLAWVRRVCVVGPVEEQILTSSAAPIVLLERRKDISAQHAGIIAEAVAPGNPWLGVMLPYSPLHHVLLHQVGRPVVVTSGNLGGEPICIDDLIAWVTLKEMADAFLVHNRPIRRHADDSVARVVLGGEQVLRRARGYAPLPIAMRKSSRTVLAVGAHLKNTVAMAVPVVEREDAKREPDRAKPEGINVFVSQHIGDLETSEAFCAFKNAIDDLQRLYDVRPETVVADLHPDYVSSLLFENSAVRIQHHAAHVAACLADNGLEMPALGVAWDGSGYGPDGTIWGGEFLLAADGMFKRVAHLRTFPLPGGEAAIRKPRHSAAGMLFEVFGAAAFRPDDPPLVRQMLARGYRAPRTSSAGRVFDAVASLAGIRDHATFEGQAAMDLEFAIDPSVEDSYPFVLREGMPSVVDWEPMIRGVLEDVRCGVANNTIAARFHNTLVDMIVSVANRAGQPTVALTGGCFQNRYLTERAVRRLTVAGFHPCWHRRIPPNDGGIALGQIAAMLMTENVCASQSQAS